MFRKGSLLVAAVALLGAVGFSAQSAHAATKVYPIVVRGIVTDFDEGGKTFKLDVTKAEPKRAEADLDSGNVEFTLNSNVKVVKNANGKDKPVTYHNLAIGQEIAFKGFKMDDDTYLVNFIRISDRSFTMVGNLEAWNTTANTLKLLVIRSTYQPAKYVKKNVEVNMVYGDDYTTLYTMSGNTAVPVSEGDINADAQKVKVTGYITGTNTWKVTKLWNNYKGN